MYLKKTMIDFFRKYFKVAIIVYRFDKKQKNHTKVVQNKRSL